ncbi:cell wall hydrolase [Pelagibacterium flavum]|uniref:Cell wall hydrolase n=1 Tax=Pelagibacterium flavum TaxID=2984530 RepID=A0ABY6IK41_9HYPH|nr:cell wall hydrolase [Pelagibacterium sp. YIM 151497]UYQ70960.1 cell wall hydrolase [Pelagibacterium sp. YIM 151497]
MALTNEQKRILAQTLLGEAGGEGLEGMIAVAHSINNRARSGRYPSDPVSVALQPQQYSAWNNGEGGNNPGRFGPGAAGYEQAMQAVEAVFEQGVPDPTGGATHYWSPRGMPGGRDPYWAGSEQGPAGRLQIGNHVFLPQQAPQSALAAANALAGAPPVPPERPTASAYAPTSTPAPPVMPPLPMQDPRTSGVNSMVDYIPPSMLPRLNDADINQRAIDTFGPDPQATSPTQPFWNEWKNWMEQSSPSTPSARGGRNVPDLPNIPGTPAQRGSVRPTPQMPYSDEVLGSLNNRLTSGVMDPASDMTPFNAIFDQYQPQETASVAPPMPRSDPRRLQGYPPVPFPWPDDLPTPSVAGVPSITPVPSSTVTIADLPPLPGGTQVASAPVPPMRPAGLSTPPTAPVQVADLPQAPVPPQRPPMATYAGQTTGGNPVETAGQFLGDFQNNGGLLGMGLNAMLGRGLFPGDEGVIPQFKQGVADRTAELNGDFLGGFFSRRAGPAPTFSTSRPEGRSVSATRVGPSGSTQGYLTESQKPRMGSGNYNASVRDANMDALRGVEGRTMREKIENYQRSGGTLYKA